MVTGIYQSLMMSLGIVPFYITDTYFHHKYDPKRDSGKSGRSWLIVGGSLIVAAVLFLQPVTNRFVPSPFAFFDSSHQKNRTVK
ncbi:MAG: hypothetical protein IPM39_17210 [Chloroflexi bacterium]|nr:hypothetical protein [Chloroflexota bacterium]